jgi:predicted acyltransferase
MIGERNPTRFDSVDALRGVTVAAMLLVNDPGDWGHVFAPLKHADWHGCTPTDLVFPFFLFVVGVSIALVIGKYESARGHNGHDSRLSRAVMWRALRIIALGLALHAIAHWLMSTPSFRPLGVLQRIGICFGLVGLLAIHTQARTQWLVFWAILLGYWALLAAAGGYGKEDNLASRLDAALFGRFAYEFNPVTGLGHEPEGLLSTLPAIATTLLGVRAGEWLRRNDQRRLAVAGVGCLAAGWAWSLVFPLNKQLWTSSFVLWTGGWAILALLAFHILIDERRWPAIGRRFGVNAIAAYAGAWLLTCVLESMRWMPPLYTTGFAWMTPYTGPYVPSTAFAVAYVMFWWLVVLVLDRRGIRIKI